MHAINTVLIKQGNRLTAELTTIDWERWKEQIEVVQLKNGHILFEAEKDIKHVYFPLSGIISQQFDFEDGKSAEFDQIGNEGMAGVTIFMGSASTSTKAIVLSKGIAYRIPTAWMLNEFTVSGSFRSIVLQYLKTMIVNISQIAVCNRRHTIDQQLCRTLLNQLDRVAGNSLSLTHEMISRSIGVRREGISEAAKRLETKGIISYVRGNITIIDRESLIKNSCECYSIMNKNSN